MLHGLLKKVSSFFLDVSKLPPDRISSKNRHKKGMIREFAVVAELDLVAASRLVQVD